MNIPKTNILWTGRAYYSLENCLVSQGVYGSEIHSTIIGAYEEKIYQLAYKIRVNAAWETLFFEIVSRIGSSAGHFAFESDGKGNWTTQGRPAPEFEGCIDIDIPLTPFTNTLPIRRLQLKEGEEKKIRVFYIDLLAGRFMPVEQQYRRISASVYHYENVPNDFEADIKVDENGLVADYPQLFVRTAISETA